MTDLHYDPNLIDRAASNMLCEPKVYMDLAHRYAAEGAALSPIALGVVGTPIVLAGYNPAQQALAENLAQGSRTVQDIANGLARVAANYRGAENANTVIPSYKVDATYTEPRASGGGVEVGEEVLLNLGLGATAAAVLLQPVNAAAAAALTSTGHLEPVARISSALWALFTPLDPDVNKAIDAWKAVKKNLDNLGVDTALQPLADGWKADGADNSKTRFDQWLHGKFNAEVTEVATGADKTAQALEQLLKDLHVLQVSFLTFALAALATIISAWIAEAFPPAAPACEMIKKTCALILNAGTATAVAAVAAVLAAVTGEIGKFWASLSNLFPNNEINAGGGTTFKDVSRDLNWNTGQVR